MTKGHATKGHSNVLFVVRLRGDINTIPKIKDTLHLLRLRKVNHCVVIPRNVHYMGMLQVVKDYVTWGEVDEKTLAEMIVERGRLLGDRPITDQYLKDVSEFKSVHDLAVAVASGKFKYSDLKDVKPLFRLHPPVGGVGKTKRHYSVGGVLGYRGGAINEFVSRMLRKPAPKPKKVKMQKVHVPIPPKRVKRPTKKKVKKAPKEKKSVEGPKKEAGEKKVEAPVKKVRKKAVKVTEKKEE